MAQTEIAAGVGLRHIRFYKLDANGYPSDTQAAATGYPGVRLSGAKSFVATRPDPQVLTHLGDDRPLAQDSLPPTALETAVLTTAKSNLTADAQLSGVKVSSVGESKMIGRSTNEQGQEPQVAIFGWRQALDLDPDSPTFKQRMYFTRMYPAGRVIAKGSSTIQEGQTDTNDYNVIPTIVQSPPWGLAFTTADQGYTQAAALEFISANPLMMERWTGNNTLTVFNLTYTPITVAKTKVFVNGVVATVSSIDTGAKTMTLSIAPANASAVVAWYEASDIP